MKRANLLVGAGAALLIIGLAAVWFLSRDDEDDQVRRTVSVVLAQADLEAGDIGEDLVAAGKVSVVQVADNKVAEGALTNTASLTGMVLTAPVEKGEQLVGTAIRQANLRAAAITIPEGKQAMAVTVDFTQGAAGYAAAGDKVNIYTTLRPETPGVAPEQQLPLTKLLLSDIEVLDVSNELAPQAGSSTSTASGTTPTAAGRPNLNSLTLLLAVDAQQAEQVIFASELNSLWFTVLAKDQGPSETEGVTYAQGYVQVGR